MASDRGRILLARMMIQEISDVFLIGGFKHEFYGKAPPFLMGKSTINGSCSTING
jgi:hypothetical protein